MTSWVFSTVYASQRSEHDPGRRKRSINELALLPAFVADFRHAVGFISSLASSLPPSSSLSSHSQGALRQGASED